MAFPAAVGHNNLPNGVFSPVIYSKKVQLAFRRESVVQGITNTDYFGEISNYGDSVKIMKEPDVQIRSYSRGKIIQPQDLIDEDFTMIIDKANEFAFQVEDIEKNMSHVSWESLASNRAAFKMKDQFDADVLAYLTGYKQVTMNGVGTVARTSADLPGTKAIATAGDDELLASNKLRRGSFLTGGGDNSIPLAPRMPGAQARPTDTVSPLQLLARMSRILDQQNVPQEGRWVVIDPAFEELLKDEDSRILNADFAEKGGLMNGRIGRKIHGFDIYKSNSLPKIGTGADTVGTTAQNDNFGVIVAGVKSAVATAENISKTESFRSHETFADVVRGLHVYGRKILRPEGIVTAKWNIA